MMRWRGGWTMQCQLYNPHHLSSAIHWWWHMYNELTKSTETTEQGGCTLVCMHAWSGWLDGYPESSSDGSYVIQEETDEPNGGGLLQLQSESSSIHPHIHPHTHVQSTLQYTHTRWIIDMESPAARVQSSHSVAILIDNALGLGGWVHGGNSIHIVCAPHNGSGNGWL